jgi:hypothetical protein
MVTRKPHEMAGHACQECRECSYGAYLGAYLEKPRAPYEPVELEPAIQEHGAWLAVATTDNVAARRDGANATRGLM